MFKNMREVKAANKAAGHYWFTPESMRFFRSKIESGLIGGRFFVSSEQFVPFDGPPAPRLFTVREVNPDGTVDTVGEFQAYPSKAAALAAVAELVGA